jgi:ribosome-interacting GTPase 1
MKGKISVLKKSLMQPGKSGGTRQAPANDHIDKEGAGQVILIGPPNSGKSSLIDSLTAAKPMVADYPYSTREPQAGMMTYESVQIQLIDTPPISPESYENYLSGLIRNADLVVLVCDLAAEDCQDDIEFVVQKLNEKRILLRPNISEQPEDPRYCAKRCILCGHKEYDDESGEMRQKVSIQFAGFEIIPTSILDDDSLDAFRKAIFLNLSIIRVYTKPIGKEADLSNPVILPIGSTVEDAAIDLHKDFATRFKFAKIWGEGKFDGQRVQRDFKLTDEDILEFHL